MKKNVLMRTFRTSAFVVAAFAVTALLSGEAQAQCYGGSGFGIGIGGYGGYGSGIRISYNSFRPVYGYSIYRPYYSNRHYGYGFHSVYRPNFSHGRVHYHHRGRGHGHGHGRRHW